jgi:hypothetical protein
MRLMQGSFGLAFTCGGGDDAHLGMKFPRSWDV